MDKVRIHEMLEYMTEGVLAEMKSKGLAALDTDEISKATDMIKDLACAEKDVWEKCYYKKAVEAMEEEEKEEEMLAKLSPEERERAGYDRWRRSSGRFAPKGQGHETSMAMATGRGGYTPYPPYYDDPRMWGEPYMMGYDGGSRGSGSSGNSSGRSSNGSSGGSYQQSGSAGRMGYSPDDSRSQSGSGTARDGRREYDDARRYYHESGSQESKEMMTAKGDEYVTEALSTMKDIFTDADPAIREKMKQDLFRLYREFGGKTQ